MAELVKRALRHNACLNALVSARVCQTDCVKIETSLLLQVKIFGDSGLFIISYFVLSLMLFCNSCLSLYD